MSNEVTDTVQLVQEAKRGSRDALNRLFERFTPFVRKIIEFRTSRSSSVDIDDLVQDALMRAFEGFESFDGRPEQNFRAWIAVCARCAVFDHYRRRRALVRGGGRNVKNFTELRSSYFSSSILSNSDPTPSNLEMRAERENAVLDALGKLEARHRDVILFRYLCDMPYDEIAAELAVSEGNARLLVHRALGKLRNLLGECPWASSGSP